MFGAVVSAVYDDTCAADVGLMVVKALDASLMSSVRPEPAFK